MDGSIYNLFPIIGPTEMRDYIAIGRASLAVRKTRQNQYFISYENNQKHKAIGLRADLDASYQLPSRKGSINL